MKNGARQGRSRISGVDVAILNEVDEVSLLERYIGKDSEGKELGILTSGGKAFQVEGIVLRH